jgi:hypothetical protein
MIKLQLHTEKFVFNGIDYDLHSTLNVEEIVQEELDLMQEDLESFNDTENEITVKAVFEVLNDKMSFVKYVK